MTYFKLYWTPSLWEWDDILVMYDEQNGCYAYSEKKQKWVKAEGFTLTGMYSAYKVKANRLKFISWIE